MKTIKVKLTGLGKILIHSDRLSNPLDEMTKAHKKLTAKTKKTDEDHIEIAKSEWIGSLYYDPELGPYIPTTNIRSCLVDGAKLRKLGKAIQRGTLILEDMAKLEYPGPRDIKELANDVRFIDGRGVVVAGKRLTRYRPVFGNWSLVVEITYDPKIIEADQILSSFEDAGSFIGLGDFRPNKGGTFGRFTATPID